MDWCLRMFETNCTSCHQNGRAGQKTPNVAFGRKFRLQLHLCANPTLVPLTRQSQMALAAVTGQAQLLSQFC